MALGKMQIPDPQHAWNRHCHGKRRRTRSRIAVEDMPQRLLPLLAPAQEAMKQVL
jgi:hypothetical protein